MHWVNLFFALSLGVTAMLGPNASYLDSTHLSNQDVYRSLEDLSVSIMADLRSSLLCQPLHPI